MANLCEILSHRQLSGRESILRGVWSHLHSHESFVEKLCYSAQLEGHRGCVNCLQWNSDGSILASGSDDVTTILWDPYQKRAVATMHTGHTGNIFSVKFVPFTGDKHLLTGSEDGEVRLHDLSTFDTTRVWGCCQSRVKRLATSPHSPFLCWSASEDGCVRQFDVREPHTCSEGGTCRNVLIDLRSHSKTAIPGHVQCKCIDVNPVKPEQIAVGSMDPYARIYDTRLCSLQPFTPSSHGASRDGDLSCIACFSPGHLNKPFYHPSRKQSSTVATTYLTFSADGRDLLVNLSGEQVYLFDTTQHIPPVSYEFDRSDSTSLPQYTPTAHTARPHPFTLGDIGTKLAAHSSEPQVVPGVGLEEAYVDEDIVKLRDQGKELYKADKVDESLKCLNMAISRCPNWYILYFLRGTTLYSRKWSGDVYAALRDIELSLSLNPTHRLSKQRRIQCLTELGMTEEASRFLDDYTYSHPHDTKFIERTRKDLEDKPLKEGAGKSVPNGSSSYHHTSNGRSRPSTSSQTYQSIGDYTSRFGGHCNTHTDIKEAIFLGDRSNYVAAGSDDGNIFIWQRDNGNLVRVLRGDSSIVNCIQWHPTSSIMATSGIENVVRLWEPWNEDLELDADTRVVKDIIEVSRKNQHRVKVDPFEVMLMRMGFRLAMAEGAMAANGPSDANSHADDDMGEGEEAWSHQPRERERDEGRQGGEGNNQEDWNDLGWIENPNNCRQS